MPAKYTKRQDSDAIDDGWTITNGDGEVIAHLDTETMTDALLAFLTRDVAADDPTDAELVATIKGIIDNADTVNLGGHLFDRVPCTRRKLYALARKYASEWGYTYVKAEYVPSGNRAFQRNHKKGRHDAPRLHKIKRAI